MTKKEPSFADVVLGKQELILRECDGNLSGANARKILTSLGALRMLQMTTLGIESFAKVRHDGSVERWKKNIEGRDAKRKEE